MTRTDRPPFASVRRRYCAPDDPDDAVLALAAFDDGEPPGHDPRQVLRYLRDLGIDVASLDQLHDAINSLDGEEELGAFWCREGLAVSHASDGRWFLFLDGRP